MMNPLKYFIAALIIMSGCLTPKKSADRFRELNRQIDNLVIRRYGTLATDTVPEIREELTAFRNKFPLSRKVHRYYSAASALIYLHLNPNRNNEAFSTALSAYIKARAETEALLSRPNFLWLRFFLFYT